MRTVRRPVADPDAASALADRNRELSRRCMRRYRERLRAEARIQRRMERYGVDRSQALKQLRPRTPEAIAEDRRRRERGDLDRDPLYPGKGMRDLRRTKRPRGVWRKRGWTPEARLRRTKVAAYRRRHRLEEYPY